MAKPIPGLGFSVPRRQRQDGVGFFETAGKIPRRSASSV